MTKHDRGLEDLEKLGARVLDGFETVECAGKCSGQFVRRKGSAMRICQECEDLEREARAVGHEARGILRDTPAAARRWLSACGMSKRVKLADYEQIPAPLRLRLEGEGFAADAVREMKAGKCPRHGFGLSGGVGAGKTMAIAALVKRMQWGRLMGIEDERAVVSFMRQRWLRWVSWPECVNSFRVKAMEEGGIEAVDAVVRDMSAVEVLVLDDLGAERLRGPYEDDWAATQLDLVIAARHDGMLPTWYTTNLTWEEFGDRYGARLLSRLAAENPMLELNGPDLRMVKGKA